ncbi:MAG: hypothetical protein NZ805_14395 [Armatimonadetes bacterium]|nr:hypothetical protein [Armatimonadota bacterium]MDW8029489.1 hypothetical protein [Armatimonadota bacterium]
MKLNLAKVSPDGTIIVPEELLKEAGLTESKQAVAWVEDGKLVVATVELVWREARQLLREVLNGRSAEEWIEELDKERHKDDC